MPPTPVLAILDHWLSAVCRQIQVEFSLVVHNADNRSFYRYRVKNGCQKADWYGFVGHRGDCSRVGGSVCGKNAPFVLKTAEDRDEVWATECLPHPQGTGTLNTGRGIAISGDQNLKVLMEYLSIFPFFALSICPSTGVYSLVSRHNNKSLFIDYPLCTLLPSQQTSITH